MNRLQYETSPYLLQHAHNPVDWYAWKPEAFERAKAENKPILVSIGYSTCHWCHVMERESFEDQFTADYMNKHFINIKVDREERPDIDQIYMEACQLISGSGGWPLNCFLTPDGRPFYAGTYYPPRPVHNRPSWQQIMEHLIDAYENRPQEVEAQANQLMDMIGRSSSNFLKEPTIQLTAKNELREFYDQIFHNLMRRLDTEDGGFGGAPKFPATFALNFLMEYYYFTKEPRALEAVTFSVEKMIRGGIYDQIGGGFARYATDKAWLVPHFEKMLYDNALLVKLLSQLYKLTRKDLYKTTIEETLTFVKREMTSKEGGFYAALDADSEGVEGKFYVWQKPELEALLEEDEQWILDFYGVSLAGNWEGNNIFWRQKSLSDFAKARQLDESALRGQLPEIQAKLLEYRAQRVRPGTDDKILLDWNAMQCSAYAQAFQATGQQGYKEEAINNLQFLLTHFAKAGEEGLYHTYKNGQAQYDAFLDDYANLITALLDVYEISFDEAYLEKAQAYIEYVIKYFLDTESNLFYFTSAEQQDIILRKQEVYDSAVPSGNATMVHNLWKASIIFGKNDYQELAINMLKRLQETIGKYPSSFGVWASAMRYLTFPYSEIAVIGEQSLEKALQLGKQYMPNALIMQSASSKQEYPLLADKTAANGKNIFVCKNYSCQLPVESIKEALQLVEPTTN
ncbi:MAG: thioredoxin domain-containing protein [Saprospiraceae bacterium]|nr:thioredoxin domain-containing protein [Saprospiraceae bacterium]